MGRVQRTMAVVSWLALALGGCGPDAYRIPPAKAPSLVDRYWRHEAVIWYRGKRYPVREKQEPKLRVSARSGQELSAPLGDIGTDGDALTFPNGERFPTSELTSAELVIEGEPLASFKGWNETSGERPLSTRRSAFGFQLGGTSFFQLIYRLRLSGPLLLDLGGFGFVLPPGGAGANVSAGLVVDVPLGRRWSIYTGAGGAAAFLFAGDGEGTGTSSEAHLYGRLGFAVRLGPEHRDQLGIDGGVWYGVKRSDDERRPEDNVTTETHERSRLLWPMAGVFYLRAL